MRGVWTVADTEESWKAALTKALDERDEARARVAKLEATLRDIEAYTNGPSTQTWAREGVIWKCRAALGSDT